MELLEQFKNPPSEYGPVPVWHWKEQSSLEDLLETIKAYNKKGISECVAPADALRDLPKKSKQAIYQYCRKNSFKIWLYIKGWINTPSSDLQFSTLRMLRYPVLENRLLNLAQYDEFIRAIFLEKDKKFRNIPDISKKDQIVLLSDEADQVLIFQEEKLEIPVSEKVDLASYYEEFREEINHSIHGFFVDPVGFYRFVRETASKSFGKRVLWSKELVESQNEKATTIDLNQIWRIWFDDPDSISRFRVQYYTALNSLFKKNYSKPIQDFCKEKNIKVIGRFHFDEFLNESIQNYRHSDISTAIFSYAEKLTSSASWISGETRTISETYAFSQWESTLEKMKSNTDWEYLKGIDKVLLYGDSSDPRFKKYSYWDHFSQYSDYVKRMGHILSNSRRVCQVGVFYPIKSSYGLMVPNQWDQVDILESMLSEFSNLLLSHQIDHHFINHDKLMEENLDFRVLIFCRCQCLYFSEIKRMQRFVDNGGSILFLHTLPNTSINKKNQDDYDIALATLLRSENVHYFTQEKITNSLTYSMNLQPVFSVFQKLHVSDIHLLDPDPSIHIIHRQSDRTHFYFIVNTGGDVKNNAIVFPDQHKLEMWNAENGKVQPIRVRYHEKKDVYSMHMYPYESKLFVYNPEKQVAPSSVFVFHNGNYKIGGIPVTVSGIPSSFVLRGDWIIKMEDETLFESHLSSLQQLNFSKQGAFRVIYKKSFILPNEYSHFGLVIDLGEVRDNAELYFNGKFYGRKCWTPYRYQVYKSSLKGENTIQIEVTGYNTEQTIGISRRVGLLGPVRIIPYQAL